MIEKLERDLPHGSGIDYDWQIEETEKHFICRNAWHYMNANGYYDGILPFTLKINKANFADFKLTFSVNSAGRYRVNKGMIREYLEDLFQWRLSEIKEA